MDVGITQSDKSHPIHFFTGLLVVMIGFSGVMLAVRVLLVA